MKKIQLRQLIRETIKESLNENISNELDIFNKMKNNSKYRTYLDKDDVTEDELFNGENRSSKKDPGIYLVGRTDDYGRITGEAIGYYKADSRNHASLKAAIDKNNIEVYFTGYYSEEKVEEGEIEKMINDLEMKLANLKGIQ